jgi:hypothetical protein
MTTFFRCAALAPLLALVAGCCANNACNCDDLQADSLFFLFNTNAADPKSFSASEIDTVYLRRYSSTDTTTLSDPVTVVPAQRLRQLNSALAARLTSAGLPVGTLVISNSAPFSPSITGGKLSAYNYLLTVKDGRPGSLPYNFKITSITLAGNYEADGCCTCYRNTGKRFRLNGSPYLNVTETGGLPIATTLSKP